MSPHLEVSGSPNVLVLDAPPPPPMKKILAPKLVYTNVLFVIERLRYSEHFLQQTSLCPHILTVKQNECHIQSANETFVETYKDNTYMTASTTLSKLGNFVASDSMFENDDLVVVVTG